MCNFYYILCGEGCAFFASSEIINLIEKNIPIGSRDYLMDATFRIVPVGCFRQLLVIYIAYQKQIFPLIYILMTNKSQALYKAAFNFINKNIFKLCPTSFATDFERAMRIALKLIYPDAILSTCWFHYTQSVRRFASKIENFFRTINANGNLSKAYHMILSLPLLPAEHVAAVYNSIRLKVECDEQNAIFGELFKYFESQWLRKVIFNSIIPIDIDF